MLSQPSMLSSERAALLTRLDSNKDFKEHILIFHQLINQGFPFAFSRISDGELLMLRGGSMALTHNGAYIGKTKVNKQNFKPWDYKSYNATDDHALLELLIEAIQLKLDGYILGLPCRCCVGNEGFHSVLKLTKTHCSWANLLVNSNYPYFIEKIIPCIQNTGRQVVLAVNKRSSTLAFTSNRPIHVPVPDNVFQNYKSFFCSLESNLSKADDDAIVLIGASTIAKIAIPQFYQRYPSMTFIDIGTTLNPLLGLDAGRDYLISYWKGIPTEFGSRICIW